MIIPCEWSMIFNVDSFTFGTLYIDGLLKFDPSQPETNITATNIYVRAGSLNAGTESSKFPGKINIKLTGSDTSEQLLIDDFSDSGTMVLAVTGKM